MFYALGLGFLGWWSRKKVLDVLLARWMFLLPSITLSGKRSPDRLPDKEAHGMDQAIFVTGEA